MKSLSRLLEKRKKDKRGSIDDLIYIIILVGIVAFLILIGFKVLSSFNDHLQTMSNVNADAKNVAQQVTNKFPGVVDGTFLFLVIGMCLVAIVLAFLVKVHPVFFIFYIIFVPIIIFISGVFSNLYQTAAESTVLASTANQMVFMSHIVKYLPMIIGVFGFVLAIVMYNSWRADV